MLAVKPTVNLRLASVAGGVATESGMNTGRPENPIGYVFCHISNK
jgi:hypothetical protein